MRGMCVCRTRSFQDPVKIRSVGCGVSIARIPPPARFGSRIPHQDSLNAQKSDELRSSPLPCSVMRAPPDTQRGTGGLIHRTWSDMVGYGRI